MRQAERSDQAPRGRFEARSRSAIAAGGVLVLAFADVCSPAKADEVNLTPTQYAVTFFSPTDPQGDTDFSATPFGRVTGTDIGEAFSNTAASSGNYSLFIGNELDSVEATLAVTGSSYSSAFGLLGVTVKSSFQVEVVEKSALPEIVDSVPITTMATGTIHSSGANSTLNTTASASAAGVIYIVIPSTPPIYFTEGSPTGDPDIDEYTDEYFPVGVAVSVTKLVQGMLVLSSVGGVVGASFDAQVDPMFEIDPSFPYASDFELEFSPGYSAGSSVPEPATWTMLAAGFVALDLVRRRRKQRLSPTGG
jgi:hypothetical protein